MLILENTMNIGIRYASLFLEKKNFPVTTFLKFAYICTAGVLNRTAVGDRRGGSGKQWTLKDISSHGKTHGRQMDDRQNTKSESTMITQLECWPE